MICKKCHQYFTKKRYARHKKRCNPSPDQSSMIHHKRSTTGSSKKAKDLQKKKGAKE